MFIGTRKMDTFKVQTQKIQPKKKNSDSFDPHQV